MCYGTQIKGRQKKKEPAKTQCFCGFSVARLKGLEPLTYWFVASHSIQLSYSRILFWTLCIPDS